MEGTYGRWLQFFDLDKLAPSRMRRPAAVRAAHAAKRMTIMLMSMKR
jgi:hypothetical protein